MRYGNRHNSKKREIFTMAKQSDDLGAVRIIAEALKDFEKNDQERIIRWARERVGLDASASPIIAGTQPSSPSVAASVSATHKASSIKEFIESKNPKRDIHFAATVAYYYQFEALAESKKDSITSADLLEACRLSNRARFEKPIGVLNNAESMGLLDRAERGQFKINAVGENLVAMGLPSGNLGTERHKRKIKRSRKKKVKK